MDGLHFNGMVYLTSHTFPIAAVRSLKPLIDKVIETVPDELKV